MSIFVIFLIAFVCGYIGFSLGVQQGRISLMLSLIQTNEEIQREYKLAEMLGEAISKITPTEMAERLSKRNEIR